MKNNKTAKQRNSSIELLRIISMAMIVFYHFAFYGEFAWNPTDVTLSQMWCKFISMGGKVGVNVFLLISGYYLVSDNSDKVINIGKVLKIWGQLLFYSVVIYVIAGVTGISSFGIKSLIGAILPVTFEQWWFASGYFVLYLLHPFINKLLNSISKAQYRKLLVLLVICWSVIPTVTNRSFQGSVLSWFITVYIIAGYIRLHGLNPKFKTGHYFVMWLVCTALTYLSGIAFTVLGVKWPKLAERFDYLYWQEKITTLLISISLFMVFATLQMKCHKWINVIASGTFAVYLIHDHDTVRTFLWHDLFQNRLYQNSPFIVVYSVLAVLAVFIVCVLIDFVRQLVFERIYMSFVDKYSEKLLKPVKALINWAERIVFGK